MLKYFQNKFKMFIWPWKHEKTALKNCSQSAPIVFFSTAKNGPVCPGSWKPKQLFQCFLYLIQIFAEIESYQTKLPKKRFGGLAMSKQSKLTICGIGGEWISNKKKSNRAIGFGSIYQVSLDCNGTKMDEKENWLASKLSSKSFVFKDFCFDLT